MSRLASGGGRAAGGAARVDELERRFVRDGAVLALVTSGALRMTNSSAARSWSVQIAGTHVVVAFRACALHISVGEEALVLLAVQLLVLVLLEPAILVQLQENVLTDSARSKRKGQLVPRSSGTSATYSVCFGVVVRPKWSKPISNHSYESACRRWSVVEGSASCRAAKSLTNGAHTCRTRPVGSAPPSPP